MDGTEEEFTALLRLHDYIQHNYMHYLLYTIHTYVYGCSMHPTTKECIHGDDLNSDDNSEESYALNNEDSKA